MMPSLSLNHRLRFRPPPWGGVWPIWLSCLLILLAGARVEAAGDLRLERIEVEPSSPALLAAVQQRLGLWPGDSIEADDLAHARERLEETGWFDGVEVYAQPGSRLGAVILFVEATLDRGVHFESGVGYEPFDGWYSNLAGLRVQNRLGSLSELRLLYRVGLRRQDFMLDLVLPRRIGPLDLLLRARSGAIDWNVFSGDVFLQQIVDSGEASVGLRWRSGGPWSVTAWARQASADPQSLERQDDSADPVPWSVLPGDTPRIEWNEWEIGAVYDRRVAERSYRHGIYGALRARVGRFEDGKTFGRYEVQLLGNLPIAETTGLSLQMGGRWADRATPYFLRPIFGGLGTVRGYRDASLSGPLGARGYVNASAELTTPLLPRDGSEARVLGAIFVDGGSFVDAEGQWRDPVLGVGWGLRIRVPWIDHLSFDVGIPLSPTGTSDPFWIHARLGVGF